MAKGKMLQGTTVKRRLGKLRAAIHKAKKEYDHSLIELQARCSHERADYYNGGPYSDAGWECPDCRLDRRRPPEGWVRANG